MILPLINDKAISFAGIVDPLEGTASAEVMNNFRQELSLSLGRDGFRCRELREMKMQPWSFITTHTVRVRQFGLCVLVSCPQANQMHRRTKPDMSPEV